VFFFQEGFTYRNFLMDVLGIFFFVVWFWLLIVVFADLFRRRDELRRGFSTADEIQKFDALKKRDRSATPNLQDYVPGSSSNEGGALAA